MMMNKTDNHTFRTIRLMMIALISIVLFVFISCGKERKLLIGNEIEVVVPMDTEFNADKNIFVSDGLNIKISFDTIHQAHSLLPLNNFSNSMNRIDSGKQLLRQNVIEQNDLKIGVKELVDDEDTLTYLIYTEANAKLLVISCQFHSSNKQKYDKEVKEIIASLKPI